MGKENENGHRIDILFLTPALLLSPCVLSIHKGGGSNSKELLGATEQRSEQLIIIPLFLLSYFCSHYRATREQLPYKTCSHPCEQLLSN